jgi:hypothetical protein
LLFGMCKTKISGWLSFGDVRLFVFLGFRLFEKARKVFVWESVLDLVLWD